MLLVGCTRLLSDWLFSVMHSTAQFFLVLTSVAYSWRTYKPLCPLKSQPLSDAHVGYDVGLLVRLVLIPLPPPAHTFRRHIREAVVKAKVSGYRLFSVHAISLSTNVVLLGNRGLYASTIVVNSRCMIKYSRGGASRGL